MRIGRLTTTLFIFCTEIKKLCWSGILLDPKTLPLRTSGSLLISAIISTFSLNNEITKLFANAAWRIEIRLPPTRAAISKINQIFFRKKSVPAKRVENT